MAKKKENPFAKKDDKKDSAKGSKKANPFAKKDDKKKDDKKSKTKKK